ncbi:MAG TPA: NAD(P)-dependent oxidoreductase [Steroidobacteraceae bacterium]|nr:NAD(P)-dependent oxidoreductase [Steroidobacteraceae bacterium]
MQIGFIGLGLMGRGIAANLARAGHRMRVWNRSSGPVAELVALGAEAVSAPREAANAEALFLMLSDDDAVRSVLIESGVLASAPPGLTVVNLATISVLCARELAERHRARGIGYVAAPVFGRPDAAAAGKLNVVVAGERAAVQRVEPLLKAIGERLWPVGEAPERANVVKLAGNFMIASALEAMGEACALARAYGIDAATFLDILSGTLFAAPVYRNYGALIAAERYEPAGFPVRLGLKDVRLALAAGDGANVPLPLASLVRDSLIEALAAGAAERDWAALAQVALRRAGLDRRTR